MKVVYRELDKHVYIHVAELSDWLVLRGNTLVLIDAGGKESLPAQWGFVPQRVDLGVYHQKHLPWVVMRKNGKPALPLPSHSVQRVA